MSCPSPGAFDVVEDDPALILLSEAVQGVTTVLLRKSILLTLFNSNFRRLTQSADFFPFVGHFSPRRAKNDLYKEVKYHAAVRPEPVEGQAITTFAKSYICHS